MVFRFSNSIFEPIWNRSYIDHVQITAAETVGVEHRGGYYETAGALRDMVPNHLFQLLTMTSMEPPISFDADEVRDEQAEVLHAIQPLMPEDVLKNTVRGQYGDGTIDGEHVSRYRDEPDVAPNSNTETFVALKLQIDNWRWAGVPFYLRTGKRLAQRATEIVIQFRRTPFVLFRNTTVKNLETNRLVIHIQPEEGISLSFGAKVPGSVMKLGLVNMDFDYCNYFGVEHSTGYERLLARLHGGRRHALPARRHGRSRMERHPADPRRLARASCTWLPELRIRLVGSARCRRVDGARRPQLAPHRRRRHRSAQILRLSPRCKR